MLGSRRQRGKSRLVAEEHQVYRAARNLSRTTNYDYGYCAIYNLRGEQMHVSDTVPDMDSDDRPLELENRLRPSRQQRNEDRAKARRSLLKPISWMGLRGGFGFMTVSIIVLCVLVFGLWSHTRVTALQKNVNQLVTQVMRSEESLESTKLAYESSLAAIDVAYNARNLGLVSAKGVEAILLYVPEEAELNPAQADPVLPRDTLATILGY